MGPKLLCTQRKNLFLPGYKPWNKGMTFKGETSNIKSQTTYVRLTREDFERTTNSDTYGNGHQDPDYVSQQSKTVMLLRPKRTEPTTADKILTPEHGYATGHRLIDMQKLAETINLVWKQHKKDSPKCTKVDLIIPEEAESHRGIAVSIHFVCRHCDFISCVHKLYKEIPRQGRGRRTAVPNMALQLGLYQSNIAQSAAARILISMSVPPASMSSLQENANQCGDMMSKSNEADMANKRRKVVEVLQNRGMNANTPIGIEIDRQYNVPLSHGRRRTPFAPATQARDIAVENVTSEKYVISHQSFNKLCRYGQRQISAGFTPSCPNHPKCTANLKLHENIGDEMNGGEMCARNLLSAEERLLIGTVTTDSDGHFAKGIQKVMKEEANIDTESFLCTTHLHRSLARQITKLKLSKECFPGRSVRIRAKQQQNLADDIAQRVQAELNSAHEMSPRNILKHERTLVECGDAILLCYVGNHELCHTKSLVCRGDYRFRFLGPAFRKRLSINAADKQQILNIISKRLSPNMLKKTRLHSSTQKAESMNAAFAVTSPHYTGRFSRNRSNREHSAIQLTNSGPISILEKAAAAGVPVEGGKKVRHRLLNLQSRRDYWRTRNRKHAGKVSKAKHRNYRYRLYERNKNWKKDCNVRSYVKGQLEKEHFSIARDHSYDRIISSNVSESEEEFI